MYIQDTYCIYSSIELPGVCVAMGAYLLIYFFSWNLGTAADGPADQVQ